MKIKHLLKKTLLLLALMGGATSAWADDAVSSTQTFTNGRATCTWNPISATVAKGNTAGGDGLYFTAGSSKSISTSSGTVQGGSGGISVVYVQVASATSHGTITMTSSSDASDRPLYLESYDSEINPDGKVVCAKSGSTANFTSADVVSFQGGYYVRLSNTDSKDVKIKTFAVTLTGETYPESVAADPVFSLTSASISTSGTSQIRVGSKGDLDGIELSSITYGTSGVVTVDENGVVTPVAAGTTTINFNSSAVASKYNASTGNSLTITVIEAVTVFNVTSPNTEFVLSKTNIQTAVNEFVTTATEDWASRTPSGYSNTDYYNLSGTSRFITFKVSGASTFQIIIQNGSGSYDRKYSVKIGDADAEDITAPKNTTSTSKVFATGSTGEVTIKIIGTSDGSLYPAAIKFNPTVSATIGSTGWTTFSSAYPLDLSNMTASTGTVTAYYASGTGADCVIMTPTNSSAVILNEGLMLKGTAGATITIPVAASAGSALSGNMLVGCYEEKTLSIDDSKYVLVNNGGTAEFQCLDEYGATIPAGKAYLDLGLASSARSLRIVFAGDITGISEAKAEAAEKDGKFVENGMLVIKKNGKKFNAAGAQLY